MSRVKFYETEEESVQGVLLVSAQAEALMRSPKVRLAQELLFLRILRFPEPLVEQESGVLADAMSALRLDFSFALCVVAVEGIVLLRVLAFIPAGFGDVHDVPSDRTEDVLIHGSGSAAWNR
jgi:hypothetical protein